MQLLTILFRNPNFLILDEPTNDLDLQTLAVLENFLSEYQGCLIIVSHDRYFMDRLVDHLFVFEGEGRITDYPGNYSQYRIDQVKKEKIQAEPKAIEKPASKPLSPITTSTPAAKRKRSFKEQREMEMIEKELEKLTKEKEKLTGDLASGSLEYSVLQEKSKRIQEIDTLLPGKEMRWLELDELGI